MREYVSEQTAILLERLASRLQEAASTGSEEKIHDLRVSIRRLSRCLRVFAQFYHGKSWKRLRRRLAELMDACGAVRDQDIAIALLAEAGVPPASPLLVRLGEQRHTAQRELVRELRRWKGGDLPQRWQARLEV